MQTSPDMWRDYGKKIFSPEKLITRSKQDKVAMKLLEVKIVKSSQVNFIYIAHFIQHA